MMNYIWPIFIICSIVYAILVGNIDVINNNIFDSCKNAVELSITFLGTVCLWTGLMEIVKNTSMIEKLKKMIRPLMKILFPKINRNDIVYEEISMNIIANILGLGNAATPMGLKAMESLEKINKNKGNITSDMMTLIILNTASIQLIPTTVIAIRSSLGSNNASNIIVPVWISTICAAIAGIVITKIIIKGSKDN